MPKELKCALCAEWLIAPAWSRHINSQAVRNFWHCTNCGYVFESLDRKMPVQIEFVKEFLPAAWCGAGLARPTCFRRPGWRNHFYSAAVLTMRRRCRCVS